MQRTCEITGRRSLAERYTVTGGSIVGREHVRLHRNNQDGLAIRRDEELIVAAVTDGCSGGRCSEVGARLGAAWLAARLPDYLARGGADDVATARAVSEGLLGYLGELARRLTPDPAGLPAVVADYLLFTFMVAVVDPDTTRIFGMGDGVWAVNGNSVVLDPGEGNAPAYLAYRLLEGHGYPWPERLEAPLLHFRAPTEGVRSLIVGSDGLADLPARGLDPFVWEERFVRNPVSLQRQLVVLGERRHGLPDDTSMVLIRRSPGAGR